MLAEWVRDRWREYGLEQVEIVEHEVLLPYATTVQVEMVSPAPWRATLREQAVDGDPFSARDTGVAYHAYSASGDVTAPVVYAGSGNPDDYDWLAQRGVDVRGKIVLVRYSVPYSYRGFKALTAEQRGAAGILIYSDPADDGFQKGATYPDGPWGPESHIQRGGIVYDFRVPGDPLTPGWASVPGARADQTGGRGVAAEDHQRAAVLARRATAARSSARANRAARCGRAGSHRPRGQTFRSDLKVRPPGQTFRDPRSRIASARDRRWCTCACRTTTRCGRSGP